MGCIGFDHAVPGRGSDLSEAARGARTRAAEFDGELAIEFESRTRPRSGFADEHPWVEWLGNRIDQLAACNAQRTWLADLDARNSASQ